MHERLVNHIFQKTGRPLVIKVAHCTGGLLDNTLIVHSSTVLCLDDQEMVTATHAYNAVRWVALFIRQAGTP